MVILVGSRLERREDRRSRASTLGGRDGDQPVTGSARGHAWAAARRAPEVLRKSRQSGRGKYPAGATPAERAARNLACHGVSPCAGHAPDGARRAPRAFKKSLEKVVTTRPRALSKVWGTLASECD